MSLFVFPLLVGWAMYVVVLSSTYFLTLTPRHRVESAWLILIGLGWCTAVWRSRGVTVEQGTPGGVPHLKLTALGLVTLSFFLYRSTLSLGLLSDDFVLLERAAQGQVFGGWQFFRPLPLMVWWVADRLVSEPWLLHAVNIILHGVNASLVAAIARLWGLSNGAVTAAGLLFVCFPAVEPVAWASGIQDVLLTTCCLGFVITCSLRTRLRAEVLLSTTALLAALGAKETAVVAPLLAVTAWFGRRKQWNPLPISVAAAVAGSYAMWRISGVSSGYDTATFSRYFVKELLSRLYGSLALPFTAAELLRIPMLGIATTCLLSILILAAIRQSGSNARVTELVTRCAVWGLVAVLPVWSMFYVSEDLQGSRYLYLPACGWSILLAALFFQREGRGPRVAGITVTAVVTAVWLVGVDSHLRDWHEAARIRDRVMTAAVVRLADARCATVDFSGIPDSVGGAYVFRNGFLEALGGRERHPVKLTRDEPGLNAACNFRWDGERFR